MSGVDVLAELPSMTVAGVTIRHNSAHWEVKKNRHPNTDGSSWGWIDGAPGNVCWSNSDTFNSSAAYEAVKRQRDWLEAQKSPEVRHIEAQERFAKAQAVYRNAEITFNEAKKNLCLCAVAAEAAALARMGAA